MSKETNSGTPAPSPNDGHAGLARFVGSNELPEEARRCRSGAPWWRQLLVLAALGCVAALLLQVIGDAQTWALHRAQVLIALGGIACWRWSWFILQNLRAIVYRYYTFPRLRREAHAAIAKHGPVPEVTVLATTYHEKPWITNPVFESIFGELSTLQGLTRRPKVVVVTGCDNDDENIKQIFARCCGLPPLKEPVETVTRASSPASSPGVPPGVSVVGAGGETPPELAAGTAALRTGSETRKSGQVLWPPELILLRGDKGKRPALAVGMEEIAKGNPVEDGVVIILDGDTMFQPGLLAKVLPIFRLSPEVSGVTTNENGVVKGPAWFAEWTSLRFGLRHRSMCSVSLSGKLLCLTGRFSVFRASVVVDPTFRKQVEHDVIEHWLWGSFEMLSGDDKSTWYWLSAHQKRMLYVPDAMVTTFEVIQEAPLKRAMANVRRWSGNSVRHSWRAIKLGPRKLGWFPWWCLMDQRLTTATVLFGPTVGLLALCAGRYEMFAGYLLWVMCSRLSHASIAWRQGRRFSAYYVPLQVISDWATALTKLWVMFHPAKQNWLNRGARTLNTTTGSAFYSLRSGFSHYLYGFSCAVLLVVIGLFVGFLPLFREAHLFLSPRPEKSRRERVTEPIRLDTQPTPAQPNVQLSRTEPEILAAEPWMALKSWSRDAGSHTPKNLESQPHERSNQ